jgi:flagellar biosynthesis protein FlhB
MSEDKKYPLTELKRKNLRCKGIIPYSTISLRASLISIFLMASAFAYSRETTFIFDQEYVKSNLDQYTKLFYNFVIYLLAFSFFGFVSTFISGLLQTSFLFIPFSRYPEGIRIQSSIITISKVLKFFIFFVSILVLLSFVLGFFYSIFKKEFIRSISEDTSLQFFYLMRITSFSQILYILAFIFILISIMTSIYSKLSFLDAHKMGKSEILEEMEDS